MAGDQEQPGRNPSYDIYSLSSTGRLGQLTFTGGNDPVPSPNGRLIAFVRGRDLWLMSPDGSRQRRLARNGTDPAWTPDSRRVAYVSADANGRSLGIRVVGANGTRGLMLLRGPVTGPSWSPDGRSLAFARLASIQPVTYSISILRAGRQHVVATLGEAAPPSWSSDGRWLTYSGCTNSCGVSCCTVFVARPTGADRRIVSAGSAPRWSPRGPVLAYVDDGSIRTFDVATGARHVLITYPAYPFPSSIAWSPDGTKIAYELFNGESELAQVDTASMAGRIRSLGFYPDAGGLAWTTPPAGLHYRPAQPVGPIAVGHELRFRLPVNELAADGDSVAYRTCGSIGVWHTASETVTAVRSELPLCDFQDNYLQFYSLALAGDRVAWGVVSGGNVQGSALVGSSLATPAAPINYAAGPAITNGDPRGTARAGYLIGSGSLLVFSTWAYCDQFANNTCWQLPPQQRPLVSQTLWRVREPSWPGICPGLGYSSPPSGRCQQLRVEPGPLRPLDVDAGRIVASGDNATLVLDQNGTQLLSLPISTQAAQLAGSDLVVVVQGELRDYDTVTGALLQIYPLPFVSSGGFCGIPAPFCGYAQFRLEDAARGLVAYVAGGPRPVGDAGGQLHVLRLADGRDVVVHAATAARFDDAGLVYAYTTTGIWPGRIRFTPFDQLPLL